MRLCALVLATGMATGCGGDSGRSASSPARGTTGEEDATVALGAVRPKKESSRASDAVQPVSSPAPSTAPVRVGPVGDGDDDAVEGEVADEAADDGAIDVGDGGSVAACSAEPTAQRVAAEGKNLALMNELRVANGLGALVMHDALACEARKHACFMANGGPFDHDGAQGRAIAAGVGFVGENITAMGSGHVLLQSDPERVGSWAFESWYTSSGHKANMLGSRARRVGIGFCDGPASAQWSLTGVQIFAD